MNTMRFLFAAAALLMASLTHAANTTVTVEQMSQTVTLTDDVDYVVTAATPFAGLVLLLEVVCVISIGTEMIL